MIEVGLKMEGLGEMWVAKARGQDGQVELTIMRHDWSYNFQLRVSHLSSLVAELRPLSA